MMLSKLRRLISCLIRKMSHHKLLRQFHMPYQHKRYLQKMPQQVHMPRQTHHTMPSRMRIEARNDQPRQTNEATDSN
ncbi:hypothetical protein V6N13_041326 [Hibiscus sabdariffa]